MKKSYWIARGILTALTVFICLIAMIHEDGTTRFFVTVVLSALALILSFPAERISQRMIAIGDGIAKGRKRVLYYVLLLAGLLALSLAAYFVISAGNPKTLGEGLMTVFFYTVAIVAILIPYILSVLVLVIRKRVKEETEEETEDETD